MTPPKCEGPHEWGPDITVREPDFGVAYASYRVCRVCQWQAIENWCESRSSGGVPRLYPPGTVKESTP